MTIEPGIYLPGWGGVRIEDDVHLAPAGPDVLTHFTARAACELAMSRAARPTGSALTSRP